MKIERMDCEVDTGVFDVAVLNEDEYPHFIHRMEEGNAWHFPPGFYLSDADDRSADIMDAGTIEEAIEEARLFIIESEKDDEEW